MSTVYPHRSPAEGPEAVRAQVEEARLVLHEAAAAVGIPPEDVNAAVDAAAARYADASVHTYVGILVERAVRHALGLHEAIGQAIPGPSAL